MKVTASPQKAAVPVGGTPDLPEEGGLRREGKEIVIAWEASLMYLLEDGKLVGKPLVVNSARRRYLREHHLGSFPISEKSRLKRSNLYDVNGDPLPDKKLAPRSGAVMRNWMRLGKLAVGLHYSPAFRFYRRPGARHRSHGCYRMSAADSNRVFKWAPLGTPVHVVKTLNGSEWQFLAERTPAELLRGYPQPKRVGVTASRRARQRVRRKPAVAARRMPAPGPESAPSANMPGETSGRPLDSATNESAHAEGGEPPAEQTPPTQDAGQDEE